MAEKKDINLIAIKSLIECIDNRDIAEGGIFLDDDKRISWRIQPIEQIRKRKQRKRDMWERHEKFAEYVERVKKKKAR